MRFGLFGGATARRLPDVAASAKGFFDLIETNVEAEALSYHSSFVTEHHITNFARRDNARARLEHPLLPPRPRLPPR